MKKLIINPIIAVLLAVAPIVVAQEQPDEYLGLPGDNLNLYAVMKLFQESETLEGFERSLNDENSRINNLDLNGDYLVDYLRVVDFVDGDVHTIVLQAILDRDESQDVAVFTVQRLRDGSVQIQLIGDEALYGRNYIVEPIYDDNRPETPNPGYIGNARRNNVTVVRTTYVEVAAWPLVRYIYRPGYVVWRSSWYWGYYPSYWRSWRPYYWHYYYGYHYNWYPHYYKHYRHWHQPRYARWNDFYYTGIRTYSPKVVVRIKEGNYKTTYSRPEQRRDGEALFTKTHPDQYRRSSEIPAGSNTGRRSVSQSASERQTQGTNVNLNRRSGNTVTASPGTGSSQVKNSDVSRRSGGATPDRVVTRSETVKRTETRQVTKQSTTRAGSSERRSSGTKKTETATREKSSKAKDAESVRTSRRK